MNLMDLLMQLGDPDQPTAPQPTQTMPPITTPPRGLKMDDPEVQRIMAMRQAPRLQSVSGGSTNPGPQDPGMLSRLGRGALDYLGDPVNRKQLAIGFNAMRLNPDANLARSLQSQIETEQTLRLLRGQGNKTADALRRAGHDELADLVEADPTLAKTAMTALTQKPTSFSEKVAFYKKVGYTDLEAVEAAGAAGGITVNTGQDAFMTALAKQIPDQISVYTESGKLARSQNTQLRQLQVMFDSGVPTGRFEETKNRVRSLAQSLGMDVDETAISDAQTLQAFTSTLVAEELRQNKGPQTDFDARYAQSYMPSLDKDPAANKAILDYMMSRNSLSSALGEFAAGSRSTDFNHMSTLRNALDLAANTLGAVVYVEGSDEPILFAEFLKIGKDQSKSIGEILREWEQLH